MYWQNGEHSFSEVMLGEENLQDCYSVSQREWRNLSEGGGSDTGKEDGAL